METKSHIVNGLFQSDKYPTCPPDKVPLSVNDRSAQGLLWQYAKRHRMIDPQFSDDLEKRLLQCGFIPPMPAAAKMRQLMEDMTDLPNGAMGFVSQTVPPYRLDLISLALFGLRNTMELMEAAEAEKLRRIESGELT